MLTRWNRDLLPQKTEPTPFAAKAKDLGALHDAVVDSGNVGVGLWISYLFALFYFAIAAGAVTHRDLLLESPVKLPFLNVELPLKTFFILGPLVFLILHAYVLLHFVLLAGKIGAFHFELQTQIPGDDARARLRRQLPSNIFVQSLAGPREVRTGVIGFLLRRIIEISLVFGPIALLILFQLQFLPYHSGWITSWHRIAVVIDLLLLWILWPPIARGETARLGWSDFTRVKILASLASTLAVVLVWTIATFPGEWLEEHLGSLPGWTLPHKLLVAGEVNYVTGRPQSLWSNVLVLPNFEVGDRVKFDAEGKIVISSDALSLRGRSLEGAVLVFAHLRKADFTGAQLARAKFSYADLREAKFECNLIGFPMPGFFSGGENPALGFGGEKVCVELQNAALEGAQMQGATLVGANLQNANLTFANLQGAALDNAQLPGVMLAQAQLQAASFNNAQLQGAILWEVQLQGASLRHAQLEGAALDNAQLQGALLDDAQLQGADLSGAQLRGASLRRVFVWRTKPPADDDVKGAMIKMPEPEPKYSGLDCPHPLAPGPARVCDWSDASYAALKSLVGPSVRSQYIPTLEKPPYVADEGSANAWADLAKESAHSADSYFDTLAKILEEIGCAADGAPYVIGALIRRIPVKYVGLDYFFEGIHLSQEAEVAAAFLNEKKCPGARGLSEENKAKLQEIRDRGLVAPPGAGAAAR